MGGFNNANDVLAHFGIPGMKWGKRKGNTAGATKGPMPKSSAADHKNASHDALNALAAKNKVSKHGTKSLSNKELQDLVNRMNLEQQYSKLNSDKKSGGKDFVVGLLKDSGKDIAKSYVKQFAKQGIDLAIKSAVQSIK